MTTLGVDAESCARAGTGVDGVAAAGEEVVVDDRVSGGAEVGEEGDRGGLAVFVENGVVAQGEATGACAQDSVDVGAWRVGHAVDVAVGDGEELALEGEQRESRAFDGACGEDDPCASIDGTCLAVHVESAAFIPSLLIMSAVKFAIVVMFYMHLKFDHRLFRALFTGPLIVAATTILAPLAEGTGADRPVRGLATLAEAGPEASIAARSSADLRRDMTAAMAI